VFLVLYFPSYVRLIEAYRMEFSSIHLSYTVLCYDLIAVIHSLNLTMHTHTLTDTNTHAHKYTYTYTRMHTHTTSHTHTRTYVPPFREVTQSVQQISHHLGRDFEPPLGIILRQRGTYVTLLLLSIIGMIGGQIDRWINR
jgi:carbohydrate-binding DOMON domain-containing protein